MDVRRKLPFLALVVVLASCTQDTIADGATEEVSSSSDETTSTETGDDDDLACASGDAGQASIEFLNAEINPNIDATCIVAEISDHGFALDCSGDTRGPIYEFGHDLGMESAVPFVLGQAVALEYEIGLAWVWVIRDAQGRPLIMNYSAAPSGMGGPDFDFDLPIPPILAPLQVSLVDGLCTPYCEGMSISLDPVCWCARALGLEFKSGGAALVLTPGRTGMLRGEVDGSVFVDTALVNFDCPEAEYDYHGLFTWLFVAVP
jgi:hypothetical protein